MNAVIKTGGKQYLVKEGYTLNIEKIEGETGSDVVFENVLLTFDDEGNGVMVGQPTVSGARVSAKIVEQGRAKKISVVKYKPKVRYRRNVGHRQPYTQVSITSIQA